MAHSQGFVAFKRRGPGAVAPGSIPLWPMAGFVFVDPELNYATLSFETIHCLFGVLDGFLNTLLFTSLDNQELAVTN